MRPFAIVCLLIFLGALIARAGDLNDEVLDARIQLVGLRHRYGEKQPKTIEAEARIDVLAKAAPPITPSEYLLSIKHRIVELNADEAVARLHYDSKHPKMVEIEDKLQFLREEEEKVTPKPEPVSP